MTRAEAIEKAIENLKKLKSFHNGSYGSSIKMAISALEQERVKTELNVELNELKPCDDTISDIMGISKSRTHDIMENELRCVQRASCGGCDRECGECPLMMDDKEIIKAYGYVIRMLELPSVQPSRKGHWIRLDDYHMGKFECSECHTQGYVDTCMYEPIWEYCPRCGADMRGDTE